MKRYWQEISIRESWTNMVFENRNQAYGAYEIRHVYEEHIKRALLIVFFGSIAGIGIPLALKRILPATSTVIPAKKPEAILDFIEVDLSKDVPIEVLSPPKANTPPPAQPKPAEQIKSEEFSKPVITDDPNITETIPTQENVSTSVIGSTTVDGKESNGTASLPSGTGTALSLGSDITESPETPFINVEEMPSFPGGNDALLSFIGKHLRYPAMASSMGVTGRLYVSFVVRPNGELTNIEVLKPLGHGLDEEAIRLIKLMPFWKPGKQNGRAVSVKLTLPIQFVLRD